MPGGALGPVGTHKHRNYLLVVVLDFANVCVDGRAVDIEAARDITLRLVGDITEVDFFNLGL